MPLFSIVAAVVSSQSETGWAFFEVCFKGKTDGRCPSISDFSVLLWKAEFSCHLCFGCRLGRETVASLFLFYNQAWLLWASDMSAKER